MFKRIFKAGKLDGLNAIITGGSRGIGEACAYAFAKEGAGLACSRKV